MSLAPYPPVVASLLAGREFTNLGPAPGNRAVLGQLEALTVADLFPERSVANQELGLCCLAGLWLYHDFLERSHQISQSIGTAEGSYWHAIMHRREGDFSNAKYWVRRVGAHPIYNELGRKVSAIAGAIAAPGSPVTPAGRWDPYAWVDLCQAALQSRPTLVPLCQQIQQLEWQLLFDDCYQRASNT
jgi:hypothetical protein